MQAKCQESGVKSALGIQKERIASKRMDRDIRKFVFLTDITEPTVLGFVLFLN